jgi:hypothetical protein
MSRPLTELEKQIRTTKLEIIKNKEETDSPMHEPLHELIKDLKKGLTAEFMYACEDIYEVKITKVNKYKFKGIVMSKDYRRDEPYEQEFSNEYVRKIYNLCKE